MSGFFARVQFGCRLARARDVSGCPSRTRCRGAPPNEQTRAETRVVTAYRTGMLIEPVAGWATWRQNLERVAATMPVLDARWHDIEYLKPGGTIERLLGRREFPDQTKAHRVDRFYRADDGA